MPERANVTSIEALEAFRTSLIIYLEKARRALDEINDDVMRTRLWLENDRKLHWAHELRRRAKELELRQQELFSARISGLRDETRAEQGAVNAAKRAVEEAEAKLACVKQWSQQYDGRVLPLAKAVEKLRSVLDQDMRKAQLSLAQTIKALNAYAAIAPPGESPVPAPSSESTAIGVKAGEEAANP